MRARIAPRRRRRGARAATCGTESAMTKSSMIARWISGVTVVIAVEPSATPERDQRLAPMRTEERPISRSQPLATPASVPPPRSTWRRPPTRRGRRRVDRALCARGRRRRRPRISSRRERMPSSAASIVAAVVMPSWISSAGRCRRSSARGGRAHQGVEAADTVGRGGRAVRRGRWLAPLPARSGRAAGTGEGDAGARALERTRASHARVSTSRSVPGRRGSATIGA